MQDSPPTLVLFGMTRLSVMLAKGNVWYVEHYREAFDQVACVYLIGSTPPVVSRDDVHLVSAGNPGFLTSLVVAPLRLLRAARQYRATHFVTPDILTSWWTASLVRLLYRGKIFVMPVCTPGEIYKNTGRTFSRLPKFVEDVLLRLSLGSAHRLLVAENSPATRKWLDATKFRGKVLVSKATPEELPSTDFLRAIQTLPKRQRKPDDRWVLTYVGRLEAEKHVSPLVDVAVRLRQAKLNFEIRLVGSGNLEPELRARVAGNGLNDAIRFIGFQDAAKVAEHLVSSDVFLSTLTGTALKEAALASLPVVAFAIDYVPDLLTHGTNALLVPRDDAEAMANAVIRIAEDEELRVRLAQNLHQFARERWTPTAVRSGLKDVFFGK